MSDEPAQEPPGPRAAHPDRIGPPTTGPRSASRARCSRKAWPRQRRPASRRGRRRDVDMTGGDASPPRGRLAGAGHRPQPAAAEVLQSQAPPTSPVVSRSGPCPRRTPIWCRLTSSTGYSSVPRCRRLRPVLGHGPGAAASRRHPRGQSRPRDSWAGREGMRFIDVDTVRRFVDDLELLALDEEDQDGDSFLGLEALARLRRHRPATPGLTG